MNDVLIFIFWVIVVVTVGGIARRLLDGRRWAAGSTYKYDYQAWKEGQRTCERITKKEIELFRLKKAEREEARRTYERIALEKLEVMKTAISMGMEQKDLEHLDARLEKLIGAQKLEMLLQEDEVQVPGVGPDLLDHDLDAEISRLAQNHAAK